MDNTLEELATFLNETFTDILDKENELPVQSEDAVRVAILLLEQLSLMMP